MTTNEEIDNTAYEPQAIPQELKAVNEEIDKITYEPKFTSQELKAAFQDAKAHKMPAIETLYQWFLPLIKSISHSYSCYTVLGEDAENICWEQFYIFVKTYKGNDYCRLPGLIKVRLLSRMADAASSRRYCDPLVEYNDEALEDGHLINDRWDKELRNIHLKAAVRKLRPLRQNIIHKHYFEDLTGTQIAAELKITYRTFFYHHHSSLNELRKYYLEHKHSN